VKAAPPFVVSKNEGKLPTVPITWSGVLVLDHLGGAREHSSEPQHALAFSDCRCKRRRPLAGRLTGAAANAAL